jgi:hypothetical protein
MVSAAAIKKAYGRFGFGVVVYPATDQGFDDALAALADGHPSQLLLQTGDWWAGYGDTTESHAVVLEGRWTAPDSTVWVLLRDSNNPGQVEGFKADAIRRKVRDAGLGLLGLCPPSSASRCTP